MKTTKKNQWCKSNHHQPTHAQTIPEQQTPWNTPAPHPIFIAEHDVIQCRTSLWLVWVSCSSHDSSQSLDHPWPTCWASVQGAEKALALCKQFWATAKTLVCWQCCFGHKSKPQRHMGYCEENQLHHSKTQYIRVNFCSLPYCPQWVCPWSGFFWAHDPKGMTWRSHSSLECSPASQGPRRGWQNSGCSGQHEAANRQLNCSTQLQDRELVRQRSQTILGSGRW